MITPRFRVGGWLVAFGGVSVMRLKKNRAERNRELLNGLEQAPEALHRVAGSAEDAAAAFKRLAKAAGGVSIKHILQFEPADNRVVVVRREWLN